MKIKKIIRTIIVIFIFVVFVSLKYDSINSINDISRLNKIEIYDKNNEKFYEINNYHESSYVSLNNINPKALECIIYIEDKNFYNHSGFDIYRIGKELILNVFRDNLVGASTITQQYVKNLYFSNNQTYIRKAKELNYAIRLERIYSKDEILEGYLNTIYFGHNVYGIYDACQYYFDKNPMDITLNEIALLIALIKSPNRYSPINNYSDALYKKDSILSLLNKNGIINDSDFDKYYNSKLDIVKNEIRNYNSALLFFKDQVIKEYLSLSIKRKFDTTYQIYTNYDCNLNEELNSYIKNSNIPCDIGISIVDNQGYYLSNIGGKDYYTSTYNVCSEGVRDIGSTIKPLLYYEALTRGFTPLTTFKSEPSTFYINNQAYTFSNYNDKYENSKITLGYALATSDNIYAVKTHLYLGMNTLVKSLKNFNVSSKEIPALALGSASMSLNKLTNIYNTFSLQGKYIENKYIKLVKLNDKIIYKSSDNPKPKLNITTTYILNNIMTNTFDTNMSHNINVTGTVIAPDIEYTLAAKSGLTDYDSYFIGYNPLYTVGVWAGYTDNRILNVKSEQGIPKYIFKQAFNTLMKNKEDIWYKCPNTVKQVFTDPTLFNTGYKKIVYLKI